MAKRQFPEPEHLRVCRRYAGDLVQYINEFKLTRGFSGGDRSFPTKLLIAEGLLRSEHFAMCREDLSTFVNWPWRPAQPPLKRRYPDPQPDPSEAGGVATSEVLNCHDAYIGKCKPCTVVFLRPATLEALFRDYITTVLMDGDMAVGWDGYCLSTAPHKELLERVIAFKQQRFRLNAMSPTFKSHFNSSSGRPVLGRIFDFDHPVNIWANVPEVAAEPMPGLRHFTNHRFGHVFDNPRTPSGESVPFYENPLCSLVDDYPVQKRWRVERDVDLDRSSSTIVNQEDEEEEPF